MATNQDASKVPRRLVLCFDGTNNQYSADETDSNIVKIYELMDRESQSQYHYYQPGIGTYVPNKLDNSSGGLKDGIAKLRDSGFGTYFVNHVISGYQFLLRYYSQGDKIYIFGFSRGAYTARFLSEMIDSIGLLSMGNEEMISFAWDAFSDFQRNQTTPDAKKKQDFMEQFKASFCRRKDGIGGEVKVHFLGLFDCVNSVVAFSSAKGMPMPHHVKNVPANFVRHAISIHERRGLFQPVLFDPEPEPQVEPPSGTTPLVERWFAGNHGDVGGGWKAYPHPEGEDPPLLSDIPLRWMIEQVREVDAAAQASLNPDNNVLAWRGTVPPSSKGIKMVRSGAWKAVCDRARRQIDSWEFGKNDTPDAAERVQKIRQMVHDVLQSRTEGPDPTPKKRWMWWVLEYLPIPRWARRLGNEKPRPMKHWKLTNVSNRFGARDIPENAWKHWSVAKLRACQVDGVGAALEWMNDADTKFQFEEEEPSQQAA